MKISAFLAHLPQPHQIDAMSAPQMAHCGILLGDTNAHSGCVILMESEGCGRFAHSVPQHGDAQHTQTDLVGFGPKPNVDHSRAIWTHVCPNAMTGWPPRRIPRRFPRNGPIIARFRPGFGRCRPTLGEFGQTRPVFGLNVDQLGPTRAVCLPILCVLDRIGSDCAPTWPGFGQLRALLAEFGPTPVKFGPDVGISAEFGPSCAAFLRKG